ncbi:MAG TPA: low temperature requirement protein A [Chloroflexota bacterium]|nr:low temperature requirement protein A [Chloroflexota bacterium]
MHDLASVLLVMLSGVIDGAPEYALWALAVALEWTTPRLAGTSGRRVAPAHFVERHGLKGYLRCNSMVCRGGVGRRLPRRTPSP